MFTEDLKHGFGYIIAGLIISILATITYIGIMRWIASFMVWLSLIVVGLALFAGKYFLLKFSRDSLRKTKSNHFSGMFNDVLVLHV